MAHILLIEDQDDLRTLLHRALEEQGHSVTVARDGHEALRLYRRGTVDLVITDIQMPERDGLEVLMELRRDAPGIKVIAMSGGGRTVSSAVALEMAIPLGATATLTKPFRLEELFEVVERSLAA